jgi:hypothetical protein
VNVPRTHVHVKALFACVLVLFGGHGEQASDAPAPVENAMAGHVQVEAPAALVAPTGQAEQVAAPAAEKKLALQIVHVPAEPAYPATQTLQLADDVAPAAAVVEPAGHCAQTPEVALRKAPMGQTVALPNAVPHAHTLSRRYVPAAAKVPETPVTPAAAKTAQHAFGWLLALAGSSSVALVTKVEATVSVEVRLAKSVPSTAPVAAAEKPTKVICPGPVALPVESKRHCTFE